jgi:ligand-binding SRPBCC domain-containing protein
MSTFEFSFTVHASLAAVSDFHHDTRALRRLTPPPIFVQLHRVDPLAEGSVSEFSLWFGPLPVRWRALHTNVDPQRGFTDTQVSGPMRHWRHSHTFKDLGDGQVRVIEHIDYEHGRGWRGLLSHLLFAPIGLRFLFFYRKLATRRALERRPSGSFASAAAGGA